MGMESMSLSNGATTIISSGSDLISRHFCRWSSSSRLDVCNEQCRRPNVQWQFFVWPGKASIWCARECLAPGL
ncbi:hypothetical protein JTE90_001213 [Oedothorax gibbosus]|uniref:Uncharacterized protein n=1 Tax=Oedothorax gibbosus TaxID=931172 RepID=A0AAV6UVL0_9ARAC|nr:hypothetical protein JTE90_001213 [Oedothorax gibbosus]